MTIIRAKDTRQVSGDNTILTASDLGNKRALDVRDIGNALVSPSNSSNSPLADTDEFTGSWVERITPSLLVAVACDVDLEVYAEFSPDAINVDSSLPIPHTADSINPPNKLEIARQYWRVRAVNNSGVDATYMRLQTSVGQFSPLTSLLNGQVSPKADTLVTRAVPSDVEVAAGKYIGWTLNNKFGKNNDIDSGTVPEDVIEAGGQYTGFPDNSVPQRLYLQSTSASDTGTVAFTYLASNTSESYVTATVQLNGTNEVDTGIDAIRSHTMRYDSGDATSFNAGVITLRNSDSSNVFLTIAIGRSQSNYAVFTIPFASTAYLRRIHGSIRGGGSTSVDGSLWFRASGGSPRLRRPFTIAPSQRLDDVIYGGIRLPALSDVKLVINETTGNNLKVSAGFDIITIKD